MNLRQKTLGVVATTALAGTAFIGLAASANAEPSTGVGTTSSASDCTPHDASAAVTHTETAWQTLYNWSLVTSWHVSNPSHLGAVYWPVGANGQVAWTYNPQATRTVTDVPAVAALTCEIPLPANPLATCVDPAAVVVPADTEKYTWGALVDHTALNGRVGISVTAAHGYVFAYGQGDLTSKAFTTSCSFTTPSVAADGTVSFGASSGGAWKVGSEVSLTSGTEFTTHGGTDLSGPVTRYRLVFTPSAGNSLPAVLPDGFSQVGTSAVFFVYVAG